MIKVYSTIKFIYTNIFTQPSVSIQGIDIDTDIRPYCNYYVIVLE